MIMEIKKTKARKTKISRLSVVDQVGDAIKRDIVNEVWREGEKIPSEAEFAEMFGVNRLSVRMALQKLNTLGIIETRVGEGSFVKAFSMRSFLSEIAEFYDDDKKYGEVQQLRNLLEGECMNLAIIKASNEEKQRLKDVLDQYHEKQRIFHKNIDNAECLEEMVDADFAFHYEVVKMSHNSLYKDIYLMVQQLIRRHITRLLNARVHRMHDAGVSLETLSDTHDKIYEGIINADAEAVKKAREQVLGILPIHGMDVFD